MTKEQKHLQAMAGIKHTPNPFSRSLEIEKFSAENTVEKSVPETDFELICEWFEKAQKNAAAQGRKESTLLWGDGLQHLRRFREMNDELLVALENANSSLEALEALGKITWSKTIIAADVRAVLTKARGRS